MAKSILDTRKGICFLCGQYGMTETHHIFGGPNRRLSDEDGLVVHLCPYCHNIPPNGVHFDAQAMKRLRQVGQKAYENRLVKYEGYPEFEARVAFMKRYGKNWLD